MLIKHIDRKHRMKLSEQKKEIEQIYAQLYKSYVYLGCYGRQLHYFVEMKDSWM